MLKMNDEQTLVQRIKATFSDAKMSLDDKIYNIRSMAEAQAVSQFYSKIMEEDDVTWDEAIWMCNNDPKYSLGRKLQIYMVRMSFDPRHMKQHKKEMLSLLTSEEMEIYQNEVQGMNIGKMVKEEFKRQRKEKGI